VKTLPVNLPQLTAALEDHDRNLTVYYFDSQSGEVVFLSQDSRGSDRRWDIISNSIGRFIPIEPMDSRKGFETRKIALEWLAKHGIEPVEPRSPLSPSPLDQEAEALAAQEDEEMSADDAGEEIEADDLDEFDEDVDTDVDNTLSEDEEDELIDFVESLPGTEFNMAKFHGLLSAFAAGPMIMAPADILAVLTGFAGDRSGNEIVESETILDLLGRFYGNILESLDFESF
jgi:hypothetical protein